MPKVEREGELLTLKQDQLAYWYVITGDPKESALRAGYSESVARVDVYRYLEEPRIKAAIEYHSNQLKTVAAHEQLDPEGVIRALSYEARAGDTSASRVSALRTIADILGQLGGGRSQLPPGSEELLEALARGLGSGVSQVAKQPEPRLYEARFVEDTGDARESDESTDTSD